MSEKRNRQRATGSAIASAGGVTAAGGALGGGIPGFKSDSGTIKNVKHGTAVQRAGAAASSLRGGVFGYRTDAHRGFLRRQLADEKAHGGTDTSRVNMFHRGVGSGKIGPEKEIIRHMKAGKRGSGLALAGGTAVTAYGIHHAKGNKLKIDLVKPQDVHKAQRRPDKTNTALVVGGSTTAGASYGGARLMESQGRKWNKRAAQGYDDAAKIVPNMRGHKLNIDPRLTPNSRVGSIRPKVQDDKIVNQHRKYLGGKSKVQVEAAGRLRGAAHQHAYFGHVYGKTANIARKVPKAGLAVAGVGGVGMGIKEMRRDHPVKKSIGTMSAFGVEH